MVRIKFINKTRKIKDLVLNNVMNSLVGNPAFIGNHILVHDNKEDNRKFEILLGSGVDETCDTDIKVKVKRCRGTWTNDDRRLWSWAYSTEKPTEPRMNNLIRELGCFPTLKEAHDYYELYKSEIEATSNNTDTEETTADVNNDTADSVIPETASEQENADTPQSDVVEDENLPKTEETEEHAG